MRPGHCLEPTPTYSVEVKERVELYAVLKSVDYKFCSILIPNAFYKSHVINCLCIIAIRLSFPLPIVHFINHSDLKLFYWETVHFRNSVGSEAFNTISCEIGKLLRLTNRVLSRGWPWSVNMVNRTLKKKKKTLLLGLIRPVNWLRINNQQYATL
jgi:hypothetical protein